MSLDSQQIGGAWQFPDSWHTLDLHLAKELGDDDLEAVAGHIPGSLQDLHVQLRNTKASDQGVAALATKLPNFLRHLHISLGFLGSEFGDESLGALAEYMPESLESLKLDLRWTRISDKGLKALAEHLPRSLRSLNVMVYETKVGDGGFHAMAIGLNNFSGKLTLNFEKSRVRNASALVEMVKHTPIGSDVEIIGVSGRRFLKMPGKEADFGAWLLIAAKYGDMGITQGCLAVGADVLFKDDAWRTAHDLARANGRDDIA